MKNAMQLKAIIKNLAKEKHISAQLVMQNFMLERLLRYLHIGQATMCKHRTGYVEGCIECNNQEARIFSGG